MFDPNKSRLLAELIRQCRSDEELEAATGATLAEIIEARAVAATAPARKARAKPIGSDHQRRIDVMRPVLMRLDGAATLSPTVVERVEALGSKVVELPAKAELQREGQALQPPRYILSGWAFRYRHLHDGRRQIFDFYLPGEGVGICLHLGVTAAAYVSSITPIRLVDARPLFTPDLLGDGSELRVALQKREEAQERRTLGQLTRLGQMDALERTAHFFLEIHERLEVIGEVEDGAFSMPLTQELLGDSLGVSLVHVNRILKELKRRGLFCSSEGKVRLPDVVALAHLCE